VHVGDLPDIGAVSSCREEVPLTGACHSNEQEARPVGRPWSLNMTLFTTWTKPSDHSC